LAWLVRYNSDILFKTDSATLGREDYNRELSQRRAQSVGSGLVERGVAPTRVVAMGYGETQPVASNASARGWRLKRRVAILLKAKAR
jgi:outer membrane protein OmpA-like peptidoglycan-associated protein